MFSKRTSWLFTRVAFGVVAVELLLATLYLRVSLDIDSRKVVGTAIYAAMLLGLGLNLPVLFFGVEGRPRLVATLGLLFGLSVVFFASFR